MKMKRRGTVFVHAGKWYYAAKLPGDERRRQYPLKMPGSDHAIPSDRPRSMAEMAAARMWEEREHPKREDDGSITVEDLCARWTEHCRTYYQSDKGCANILAVRLFREMYGRAVLAELTHRDMILHRDALVRSGVCRATVNERIGTVKRMIAWALDEGMIPALVKAELTQVRNIKRGRSAARETEPVRPVDDATVAKTLEKLAPNTADMVRVHALTGMRPEEICALTWEDVDRSATPWVYRPKHHKNDWRGEIGIPRAICIGPRARAILDRHRDAPRPFSPAQAVVEWLSARKARAGLPDAPVSYDPDASRAPGEAWITTAYTRAIKRACARAGVAPWGANRLRHAFATKVRRQFGLEACRAVLGHSCGSVARITDRYSFDALEEETIRAAAPAVEALG